MTRVYFYVNESERDRVMEGRPPGAAAGGPLFSNRDEERSICTTAIAYCSIYQTSKTTKLHLKPTLKFFRERQTERERDRHREEYVPTENHSHAHRGPLVGLGFGFLVGW